MVAAELPRRFRNLRLKTGLKDVCSPKRGAFSTDIEGLMMQEMDASRSASATIQLPKFTLHQEPRYTGDAFEGSPTMKSNLSAVALASRLTASIRDARLTSSESVAQG